MGQAAGSSALPESGERVKVKVMHLRRACRKQRKIPLVKSALARILPLYNNCAHHSHMHACYLDLCKVEASKSSISESFFRRTAEQVFQDGLNWLPGIGILSDTSLLWFIDSTADNSLVF